MGEYYSGPNVRYPGYKKKFMLAFKEKEFKFVN